MCEGHLGKLESDRGVFCICFRMPLTLIGRGGGAVRPLAPDPHHLPSWLHPGPLLLLAVLFAPGHMGVGAGLVLFGKRIELCTQEDREGKPSPGSHVSNHCPPSGGTVESCESSSLTSSDKTGSFQVVKA